jgi:hypothetical protein
VARDEWIAASAEILRTPVAEAIPVAHRRTGAWLVEAAGLAIFAGAVALDFFVLPRSGFLVPLAALASMMLTIAGARHQIAIHHKARFRRMLETARRLPRH